MAKCSFCSKELERGTGKIVVRTDGKILYFDSRKCEKNLLKLGRDPNNYKWSKGE
ncbi:MAG: 50S ribosomal protein L24e [Candidatus Aenigmarchaeota archaeon]|nr:50S ribosomal protein L24e [Candidatus Aenigmarchaeota archaeon]